MENGRVLFDCASCEARLAVDRENSRHNVAIGSFGVTVSPGWCCPDCGLEGKIKNGRVIVTGRKRIPPTGAINAYTNPRERPAIKIDKNEFDALTSKSTEGSAPPDPDDCSQRRKHGYYARVKEPCPVCGGQWHETETLTEEDIDEIREEHEAETAEAEEDGTAEVEEDGSESEPETVDEEAEDEEDENVSEPIGDDEDGDGDSEHEDDGGDADDEE